MSTASFVSNNFIYPVLHRIIQGIYVFQRNLAAVNVFLSSYCFPPSYTFRVSQPQTFSITLRSGEHGGQVMILTF